MIDFVTQLQLSLIGSLSFPFKLVIASALTASEWSAFIGSRLESQSTVVNFSFFSDEETWELASHYGLSPEHADKVKAYTAGHPLHTPKLFWASRNGDAPADAIRRARNLSDVDGWYGMSIRLKSAATRLAPMQSVDLRQLLKKIVAKYGPECRDDVRLRANEVMLLKSLGVMDGPSPAPIICQFGVDTAVAWLEEEDL